MCVDWWWLKPDASVWVIDREIPWPVDNILTPLCDIVAPVTDCAALLPCLPPSGWKPDLGHRCFSPPVHEFQNAPWTHLYRALTSYGATP